MADDDDDDERAIVPVVCGWQSTVLRVINTFEAGRHRTRIKLDSSREGANSKHIRHSTLRPFSPPSPMIPTIVVDGEDIPTGGIFDRNQYPSAAGTGNNSVVDES
jgi:hypothetical protein